MTDTTNTEYWAKMSERNRIIALIKGNILQCLKEKYSGYANGVAIYNDLLGQISPCDRFTIEYNGDDCRIL